MNLISIEEKWPTEEDTDESGKIWVYRPPSMTKWDQTGTMFKIDLERYIEPLDLQISHFTNWQKRNFTKLDYTDSSRTAHNNRVQWPYWMPGWILMSPEKEENNRKPIISSNFPRVEGHLSYEEYLKVIKNSGQ
jgi:hypothetical protein